jgi:hypothetical protein
MKRPSLKAEDGAEFVGEIQRIEGGQFQASCYARNETQAEDPEYHTCASEDEAKNWLAAKAALRGFELKTGRSSTGEPR